MARKPRLHYTGAVYHVMVRGNGGQPIFIDDEDRYRIYLFLQESVEKFGYRIHAFCLMGNHVHLGCTGGRKALVPDHANPLLSLYAVGKQQAKESGTFVSGTI